jgi:hypothetical protein
MKNIHVLPTDKPSRLQKFINYVVDKIEFELCSKAEFFNKGQHIYITNDEEIKDGNWHLNIVTNKISKYNIGLLNPNRSSYKKIILTTDQDLIKDGVQAIDDDFLEWFVKNPSCESVVVEPIPNNNWGFDLEEPMTLGYKIIIPQEEPKQETCTFCEGTGQIVSSTTISGFKTCDCINIPNQEPKPITDWLEANRNPEIDKQVEREADVLMQKQETLEEAIKQELENHFFSNISEIKQAEYFINFGAKWQKQQDKKMYSEEDMKNAYHCGRLYQGFDEFMKQFKKK